MWRPTIIASLSLTFLCSHVNSEPQFITFKDGKIGVNFGGYHAGVGLGGALGSGAGGGLFAEAGTPTGQLARAGLGGAVDSNGSTAGGLYAGATAGGDVRAEAGLGGGVVGGKSAGSGFANAQAGNHVATSGLGGVATVEGSSGYSFGGSTVDVVKHKQVEVQNIKPVVHKKVHKEFDFQSANDVAPPPAPVEVTEVKPILVAQAPVETAVYNKEVHIQTPHKEIQKTYIRTKPHHHHHHYKTYVSGYVGGAAGGAAEAPQPPPAPVEVPVYYKTYQKVHAPVIQKRIDTNTNGGAEFGYTKEVNIQRNPTFFADIFNIPISTLRAVSDLITNTAGSTSVSVQKSASIHTDQQPSLSKHVLPSSSSSSEVVVQTPTASKVVSDIFAIPINTLGAVNKFLENNVQNRKKVVYESGAQGQIGTRVRLGPHGRRRAHKHVVVQEETAE